MTVNNLKVTRAASICIIITFIVLVLYFGREILFPVFMALLFAILLRPMVNFLNNKLRLPHIIAISVALIFALFIVFVVIYFLSSQIAVFMNDLPQIKKNIYYHIDHLQHWVQGKFKISSTEQEQYLETTVEQSKKIAGSSIGSITGGLMSFILIFIYTFLILLYRALILKFLHQITPKVHHPTLREVLFEIKSVVRSYISGLLLEMVIVAAMTSLGLWIIGVEYFIFLGLLTAVLNLIPYIGIIVACIISLLVAMVSSTELSAIIGVLGVNAFVQLIDNNILMPRIVGSKVSINAFASIIAVIIGGHLAGVAGMFLAIPMIAILKVVFDRIDNLKPIGLLMGDNIPKTFNWYYIRIPDLNAGSRGEKHDDDEADAEAREIL